MNCTFDVFFLPEVWKHTILNFITFFSSVAVIYRVMIVGVKTKVFRMAFAFDATTFVQTACCISQRQLTARGIGQAEEQIVMTGSVGSFISSHFTPSVFFLLKRRLLFVFSHSQRGQLSGTFSVCQ